MRYNKVTVITLLLLLLLATSSTAYAADASNAADQNTDRHYIVGNLLGYVSADLTEEMASLGYIEGENITYMTISYDFFDPEAPFDMEAFMAEYVAQVQAMVDAGAEIFVVNTDTDAVNVRPIVGNIPVVFARSDDPVATGAVTDLINPGGHATGIVTSRPHERRLQLLTEIKPDTRKIFYMYSPFTLEAEIVLQQVQAVGEELGVEVVVAPITDPVSGIAVLEVAPEDIDWLFLTPYVPFFDFDFTMKMIEVSTTLQIGISSVTNSAIPGYLMGYGPDIPATDRQAAQILDRILRGASPADLPVQIAENSLMINLEAAEAIGLEIPLGILRQADVIIRPGFFDNWGVWGESGD